MLTIQITRFGQTVRMDVEQVEFLRICPYCRIEYPTIDPDQVYCKRSHAVLACQVRTFARNIPRALSSSSINISRVMLMAPLA